MKASSRTAGSGRIAPADGSRAAGPAIQDTAGKKPADAAIATVSGSSSTVTSETATIAPDALAPAETSADPRDRIRAEEVGAEEMGAEEIGAEDTDINEAGAEATEAELAEAALAEVAAEIVVEDDEDEDALPVGAAHAPAHHPGGQMSRPGHGQGMMNGRPPQISRASNKDETFAEGDHVVYPTHGVGRVEKIAVEEIAGHRLELIHITFEENRMTLRVPVAKARSAGLRKLATRKLFDEALGVLKGRARIKRTMWSRRAQEYEAKINSGDPLAIAEVVRDLHRNSGQPDQSFSERQIYEAALERLAAELAALDQTDKTTATTKLINYLKTIA
jgi:CarD family transcriptional regulator